MPRSKEELTSLLKDVESWFEKEAGDSLKNAHVLNALNELEYEKVRAFVQKRLGHLSLADVVAFNKLFKDGSGNKAKK